MATYNVFNHVMYAGEVLYGVHHPPDVFCIYLLILLSVGWCTLAEMFVSERIEIYIYIYRDEIYPLYVVG